jgi:hypothetical protein
MPDWQIERIPLDPPPLEDLTDCIRTGLLQNFENVEVSVTQCPDLREKPFNLAGAGLGGSPKVADIGGQANLAPVPKLDKTYSFLDAIKAMDIDDDHGFILGAGAGPFQVVGQNCELMPNLSLSGDGINNLTYYAKVDEQGDCVCKKIDSSDFALMANIFGSKGLPGPVLKITASVRTGKSNFTDAIRHAIGAQFGAKLISIGGAFVLKRGKANIHVMPDFPKDPFKSREDVERWLKFYDMDSPLICLSVFHSHDPGLDLRIEHTHCFSEHGQGGHYHFDTSPDEVEYEGYFNIAEILYRIDRPSSQRS